MICYSYGSIGTKTSRQQKTVFSRTFRVCYSYKIAAEQKARVTYDNLLRLIDDPDIIEPLKFLRQREVTHYQRFGEALRLTTDRLNCKNFYAFNPGFDSKRK